VDPSARLIEYYGRRAQEYERIYQKPERQADLAVLHERVPAFFPGSDVLEVACGTGYWTRLLASVARTVLATDWGDEVLRIARSKDYPEGRVTFRRADAFALGAVGGVFDAAFAGFWWSHVERAALPRFLDGLHHRLAPGATVVFVDNRYVEGSSTPISRVDADGNSYQLRTLDDGSTHEVLKNFPSARELERAVAGRAEEVDVMELPHYWCLSYRVPPPRRRAGPQFTTMAWLR
jgi:SAM-dependent methyltransferase